MKLMRISAELGIVGFSGAEADMRIPKVGLGETGCVRLFIDKEKASNPIGDIAEEVIVAATSAFMAKFTMIDEMTGIFFHGNPPVLVKTEGF